MQEQNLPDTNSEISKKTGMAFKTKLVIGAILISSCLLITLGYVIGVSVANRDNPTPTPIVTPSITQSPEPTSSTPTPSIAPTTVEDPYEEWIEYVLADCYISLYAPVEFLPGKRGEEGTCGTFKLGTGTFTNFDDYDGVMLIVTPFYQEKDSKYGFIGADIEGYLNRIETDPTKIEDREIDLLIGSVDENFVLAGQTFKKALIQRYKFGRAEHVFYEIFGGEYVIMWGGKQVAQHQDTIELIIDSVEFIQPQQED